MVKMEDLLVSPVSCDVSMNAKSSLGCIYVVINQVGTDT